MPDQPVRLSDKKFFPALTGIRAVAAYLVFMHHAKPFDAEGKWSYLYYFVDELHIGVTVFFVLSGFLIAYRYFDTEKINFRQYIINRFSRIYPVYFLLTTLTFILFVLVLQTESTGTGWLHYLLNITFLKGFFDEYKFTGIGQSWSLTVEELFYFSAPVAFLLLKKNRKNLVLLPVCLMCTGMLLVVLFRHMDIHGFFGSFRFMFSYTYFGRAIEFFTGIALALQIQKHGTAGKTKYYTYTGLLLILVCVVLIACFRQGDYPGIYQPGGIFVNNLVLPLCVSVLFWGLIRERTIVQKILENPFTVLLGKSSYVFYLIHWGVFFTFISKFSSNIWIKFLVLNGLSIIIYKFLEEPLNYYCKKLLSKKQGSSLTDK